MCSRHLLNLRYHLTGVFNAKFTWTCSRSACLFCGAQERAQQLVQEKYERIRGAFEGAAAEIADCLGQLAHALDLLRPDGGTGAAPEQASQGPAAADDVEWEDVAGSAGGALPLSSLDLFPKVYFCRRALDRVAPLHVVCPCQCRI